MLIVEDGTGKADANSYTSVSYADGFFLARANAAWAALTTEQKEAALIQATDYLDSTYIGSWLGNRSTSDQALAWPRDGVVVDGVLLASNSIPARLQAACCELANRAAVAPLLTDESRTVVRKKVDVLETEYSPHASQQTQYPAVTNWLKPLVLGSVGGGVQSVRLVRV